MKRLMYLAFVLIMFCTSCTALKTGSLEMQGRFGEAEKYLESKVDPETTSLMYLRELCNTYCMTKNYSNCLNASIIWKEESTILDIPKVYLNPTILRSPLVCGLGPGLILVIIPRP